MTTRTVLLVSGSGVLPPLGAVRNKYGAPVDVGACVVIEDDDTVALPAFGMVRDNYGNPAAVTPIIFVDEQGTRLSKNSVGGTYIPPPLFDPLPLITALLHPGI